MEYNMHILFII